MAFEIEWIPSQFFDSGKTSNEMIIVHHTGSTNGRINSLEGTISWFKPDPWRSRYQVSAHYIIPREQGRIIQMVRDEDTAWHAGRSEWVINGVHRDKLNFRTIGIELQGDGNLVDYTPFQYEALIWLTKQKMAQFAVPVDLVRGHQEISSGKVDPGERFDWTMFRNALTSSGVFIPDNGTGGLIDDDGDGVIYIDETDDVFIPDGKDRSLFERILNSIFSIFR